MMNQMQTGFRALLKFYTMSEHVNTIMGSDPSFTGRQISADLFSLSEDICTILVAEHPRLLAFWSKLSAELGETTKTAKPIPSRIVQGAYFLATCTWYELGLSNVPAAEMERKAKHVTVHPPKTVLGLMGAESNSNVDWGATMNSLLR